MPARSAASFAGWCPRAPATRYCLPGQDRTRTTLTKQYLLNLDGHTAAYRFAMLLGTNSLVLKQESRQVEVGFWAIWDASSGCCKAGRCTSN